MGHVVIPWTLLYTILSTRRFLEMGNAMVRITAKTRESLRELAQAEQGSMQSVLEKAVEEYRRKLFMDALNASYAELRDDPEAWKEVEAERALWDGTLLDGLPEDEVWDEESRSARFVADKRSA
jgi:hypothetical protein